ncbi:MAG TPA: protease pro-enzyme activation domain-containing protein [Myxococcales bacterium]|jgi:hypothetical protein
MRILSSASLAILLCSTQALAATPRVTARIDDTQRTALPSAHPAAATRELGRMSAERTINGMSLVFSRSPQQEEELRTLIAQQHDPSSPLYRQWLTPQSFAARFGVAPEDVAAAQAWLSAKGFTIDSAGADRIRFSGTVAQIEAAFGTEMHVYAHGEGTAFAPSEALSIPAALATVVKGITNLSSFRPRAHHRPRPNFTSSVSGNHFLSPADIATIYDLKPLYTQGFDGGGQSIAVVGQSSISVADVENFQRASGIPVHDPAQVIVPNSGVATVQPGDEAESHLDLEWTSSIAPGATITFVFTGGNTNFGAFDSLAYAIDNDVAAIISVSYGTCEQELSRTDYSSLESIFQKAAAQGQSIISATGDAGSTDCSGSTDLSATIQQSLAVDYPSSSEFVTGLGGTAFSPADVAAGNSTFWAPANGSDVIGSALSYIPEQVWNEDVASNSLAAGGGGTSILTARPTWQTGVPGIPAGTNRLVPDISLQSSGRNPGYLFCSNDSLDGIAGSCSSGFRDPQGNLTVAGGTSFAAPVFAGMLAVIEQKLGSQRQGIAAQTLFSLAANPATYASAFHDITVGTNACTGLASCTASGSSGFAAGVGYDEATGLGSVDVANLAAAWPGTAKVASVTTATAATSAPALGAADNIAIQVAPAQAAGAAPTGTVSVSVDGVAQAPALALVNGAASFVFSSSAAGSHSVIAVYSGDATYSQSAAQLVFSVAGQSFTVAAVDTTVNASSSGSSAITVTPLNGYAGTINWTVSSSPALNQGCFTIADTPVPAGGVRAAASLIINASAAGCGTAALFTNPSSQLAGGSKPQRGSPWMMGLALVTLAGTGVSRRKRFAALAIAAVCGIAAMSACGGPSAADTHAKAVRGNYVVTISGADTATPGITASTTMRLTIQ